MRLFSVQAKAPGLDFNETCSKSILTTFKNLHNTINHCSLVILIGQLTGH